MNAIEMKGVTKVYKDFTLDNLNFNVPKGSIVGLVGENGAGKTTIIKLIMNSILADAGSIKVQGMDNTDDEFAKLKEEIGVVLDSANFPEVLSAKEVNTIMKYTYSNWNESEYFKYLDIFSLPLKKPFKKYSKGMEMKLGLAVALSHNAKMLILDEPTSGLDPVAREDLLDMFLEYTREEAHTILMSSHIISDLEKISDYIAYIENGKLLLFTEKDALIEKYGILKLREDEVVDIPKEAIAAKRNNGYGVELLVDKTQISKVYKVEHTSLEEIILLLVREGKKC